MKFLDITGVTTLWNAIGVKTFYKTVDDQQRFDTATSDFEALDAVYYNLVEFLSTEISNFDKNKINIIVLKDKNSQNVIAKIIILQIIDVEGEHVILGFTSLVYGQYSNNGTFYSEINIEGDSFSFVSLLNPKNIIEK